MSQLKLKKNNKSYKAYVDEVYIGFIYRSDFDKLGFDKSEIDDLYESEISDSVVDKLRDIVIYRAFDKAVEYATVQECCASDVSFKLRKKNIPDYAIQEAVTLMYEYNYFNDERYVESYTRSYMAQKSRSLIEKELSMKNLSVDNLRDIIEQVYEDEEKDEDEVIERLLEKKFKNQDLSDEKVKRRAMAFLVRHGFSFDKINNHLT